MKLKRYPTSIPSSPTVDQRIDAVRKHYLGAPTPHHVLVRAAELGLELLAARPELLVPTVKLT